MGAIVAISILLAGTPGCFGNDTTPFPPGLEPLAESTAPRPNGTESDPYPETIAITAGDGDTAWVHARAFVHAPLRTVFDAMATPDACVDRRAVDRFSITTDVEPDYDHSFVIHNEVDDIITVEFNMSWRLGFVPPNDDEPAVGLGRWQKTWGTEFIDRLEGSIVAREVSPVITELALVEYLEAASGGAAELESFLRDYIANITALSHGNPLPPL